MINGHVYNICIEEEQPNFFEGKCRCTYNHYASSNSVTLSESFVEETQLSEKSEEEEGGQGAREVWWSEEVVGGRKDDKPHKTKMLNVEEWFVHVASGQEKSGCGYTNEEKEKLEEQAWE